MIFLMNRLIEKIEDLGFRKSKFRMMKLRDKCIYNNRFWGFIGLFFFENVVGQAITINDIRYRDRIILFFLSKLQAMDMDDT